MGRRVIFTTLLSALTLAHVQADTVSLDELSLSSAVQDWSNAQVNRSAGGHVLKIDGQVYPRGFGTQARSWLPVSLNGSALKFSGSAGMDDEVIGSPSSAVNFVIHGDNKVLWTSGEMHAGDPAKDFNLDVAGVKTLVLEVDHADTGNKFDHADWVNAKFETFAGAPLTTVSDPKPTWTPLKEEDGLQKLGGVTAINRTDNGVVLQTQQGWMKITVCSPSVLRLQMGRGGDMRQAPSDLPGGRAPARTAFDLTKSDQALLFATANLQLSVALASTAITLSDRSGKVLLTEHGAGTQLGPGGKGYALEMGLGPTEHIFGHGDVTGPLDHRTMKNIGMAVEYRPRNVCTPFFMSTAGYGLFLNDTSQKLKFDYFGEKPDGYYTAAGPESGLDCFLIGGPGLKQIMANYTATVVGRTPLVPLYAFGVMWSMEAGCDYAKTMDWANHFRQDDLPLDSIQFEAGPGYGAYIPKQDGKGEKETLQNLAALDYHVAVWTPRAPHFWQDHRQWLEEGLDWIKVDPNGRDYNSNPSQDTDSLGIMKDFITFSGGARPFISDCAGSTLAALHPSIRMCDRAGRTSTWRSMMSSAMSGVPYFFCDYWCTQNAGQYDGMPDDPRQDVGSRDTIPQNIFLPTVNGQSWSPQFCEGPPWEMGSEWEKDYRYYAKLRYRLMPYYYSCAADNYLSTGLPMTRPLALEFEDDPNTYGIDANEFMFGDSLLVATAYSNMNGSRDVYLPSGAQWIDYWSGKKIQGGRHVNLIIPDKGPVDLCGLYVRAGAIIPMGPEVTWLGTPGGKIAPQRAEKEMLVDIYPSATSLFRLYEDDGTTMNYVTGDFCLTRMTCRDEAGATTFTIDPPSGAYRPGARSYLLKFNGGSTPKSVGLNNVLLDACKSYQQLTATASGWFYGQGDHLIHGPEGYNLKPRADTLWVKIPDGGNLMQIVIKK